MTGYILDWIFRVLVYPGRHLVYNQDYNVAQTPEIANNYPGG